MNQGAWYQIKHRLQVLRRGFRLKIVDQCVIERLPTSPCNPDARRNIPRKLAQAVSVTIARAAMALDNASSNFATGGPQIRELAARLDRPVVLVGMMGVGKSTIGRRLATVFIEFRQKGSAKVAASSTCAYAYLDPGK